MLFYILLFYYFIYSFLFSFFRTTIRNKVFLFLFFVWNNYFKPYFCQRIVCWVDRVKLRSPEVEVCVLSQFVWPTRLHLMPAVKKTTLLIWQFWHRYISYLLEAGKEADFVLVENRMISRWFNCQTFQQRLQCQKELVWKWNYILAGNLNLGRKFSRNVIFFFSYSCECKLQMPRIGFQDLWAHIFARWLLKKKIIFFGKKKTNLNLESGSRY